MQRDFLPLEPQGKPTSSGSTEINTLMSLCFHLPAYCCCLISAQPSPKPRSRESLGDAALKGQPLREKSRVGKEVGALSLQLCPALCDCMNCSPPGFSVHGISQARILELVAISFSKGGCLPSPREVPDPGIKLTFPALAGGFHLLMQET